MEQLSFDPLNFQDHMGMTPEAARKEAQAARRLVAKLKKSEGCNVKTWTLPGQLRKYKSFGVEDGRVRPVYYLTLTRD